jgi:hypothetical protein
MAQFNYTVPRLVDSLLCKAGQSFVLLIITDGDLENLSFK